MNQEQFDRIAHGQGFIAALDQSGGSTPRALKLYGVEPSAYHGEAEMFDRVHAMRERIVTSPAFDGRRILGAILFEMTMDRRFAGIDAPAYLWQRRHVVPFLKVDKGLAPEAGGVQLMKPIPGLADLLARARDKGIFGTKMRSVVHAASARGMEAVLDQQFEFAQPILRAGLVPILEPEVSIKAPDKQQAEALLKAGILKRLDALAPGANVMLKLTLPEIDGCYDELVAHPHVVRVVALSGGYPREEANARLARNHGIIASFSRALTEGLNVDQTDAQFNGTLDASMESIYRASIA